MSSTPRTIPLSVVADAATSPEHASLEPGARQVAGDKIGRSPVEFAEAPVLRKPSWIRVRIPSGNAVQALKSKLRENRLVTVCEDASCPNIHECWNDGTATFMVLGERCTRACGFCNVKTGRPGTLDKDEPRRVAESLALMGLKHVVITSVNRDELADGGVVAALPEEAADAVQEPHAVGVEGDDRHQPVDAVGPALRPHVPVTGGAVAEQIDHADRQAVADGQHRVAHVDLLRVAQAHGGQALGLDAQHRHVGHRVQAQHLGREFAPVAELDGHVLGVAHHVRIGQD